MLACSLFVTLEYLGTHCGEGHVHLQQMYFLYGEYQRKSEPLLSSPVEKAVVDGYVRPMMLRWGQSCRGSTTRTILPDEVNGGHIAPPDFKETASCFASIAEARQSLQVLVAEGFESLRSQKSTTPDYRLVGCAFQFRTRVLIWISKLNRSFDLPEVGSGKKDNASSNDVEALLLRVRAREVAILSCTVPFRDEMLFDKYTADFFNMLQDCKQFIDITEELGSEGLRGNSLRLKFSVDFKIIPSLWMISARCREPWLRREAILLLSRARRREAEWSSVFSAVVLSKVQIIEEEGCGAARRIRVTQITYDPRRGPAGSEYCSNPTLTLTYVRAPFDDMKGPFEERTFELTMDDLTEQESMLLCSSTCPEDRMLAVHRARWISDMHKQHQGRWTSWFLTSGRYNAPWKISLYYDLEQDWSIPLLGSISY